ncbi:MAG: SprB repeat-containing protein, partial [Xanthomarina sp.]
MKKILLSIFTLTLPIIIFAQDFNVEGVVTNPTKTINDGVITLNVTGGVEPYTYRWSNQGTSLTSNKAIGLTEGVPYTVIVTDADGNSKTAVFTVKTEAITEVFNGAMTPAVSALGSILFWDPFAAIGIYDPVVYADVKLIGIPNWTNEVDNKYILDKWLKEDGAHVSKGEAIAIITDRTGGEIIVKSLANGKLKHYTANGETIYNSDNKKHVIEEGAHVFAEIIYDKPIVLTHPNGDPLTKPISFIVIWLVLGAVFFTFRMGFVNVRG